MIVITNRGRSLVNLPAAFDGRDAIAPPGHAPYQESAPQKANAPGKGAFTGTTGTQQTKATSPAIVAQHRPSDKQFSTAQAQAARAGFELTTSHHDETGLTLWQVARWGQTRQFSEWGEVCAFVAHIGGFRHG